MVILKQKLIDIFTNLDIPWWDRGKNVTAGWVNVECPFCSDASNHCGTNPATGLFNCWRCGEKNPFVDLLMELTGESFATCQDIIIDSGITFDEPTVDKIEKILYPPDEEVVVQKFTPELPALTEFISKNTSFPLLYAYCKRRNISIDTLIEYECGICRAGEYMNRLVIPVFYRDKLVSFQAADLSGFASLKYQSAPLDMGRINDYLYGLDDIDKVMVVVEGVPDKWRTGKEAVAAFTSTITPAQFQLILNKNLAELYFCFDSEVMALMKAKQQADKFRPYIPIVEVVVLPFGKDPDDLTQREIYECIAATRI